MSLDAYLDRVVHGDCLDVLRELPDCSVDLCATDPPYALSDSNGVADRCLKVLRKVAFPQFGEPIASGKDGGSPGLVPFYLGAPIGTSCGAWDYAGVSVVAAAVDLHDESDGRQEEVAREPAVPFSIVERELPDVCDAEGSQCLGYFVLELADACAKGTGTHSQNTILAELFEGGFGVVVGLRDHALCQSETTTSVVALPGAELVSVLRFDVGRALAELFPANGTGEPLRGSQLVRPQLVRACSTAGCLSSPLQAVRVCFVDPTTNGASTLHFHLLVPPSLFSDLRPIVPQNGFMNKSWDAALPARAIWAEVLRVLKPGASCFVCAGSRQDTILGLLTDLREVGFDIQHAALSWVYWSGFPKSTDVGKDIDKAAFLKWVKQQPLTMLPECPFEHKHKGFAARKVECPECKRRVWALRAGYSDDVTTADVRKAASAAVNGAYSATVPESRVGRQRGMAHFTGDQIRPYESETHATETHGTRLLSALQARFGDAPGVRDATGIAGRTGGGRTCMGGTPEGGRAQDTLPGEYNSTSPSTPDAIAWDGWHSGSVPLKPSSEQILWVTKPAEPGPARNNVKRWGVGAVNVDGCRVPGQWVGNATRPKYGKTSKGCPGGAFGNPEALREVNSPRLDGDAEQHPSGRYPSNLLVTARALGDDSKYGDLDAWAREHGISEEWLDAALSAGVLRVPKPSRSEKNAGCEGLEEKAAGGLEGNVPGARETLRLAGDGVTPVQPVMSRNHHPTTKPTTLFAFLCTLACPRGGVVLDPFGGSGTTGVAAIQSGMHWVLIEREAEYCAIAEARTTNAAEAQMQRQPAFALEAAT